MFHTGDRTVYKCRLIHQQTPANGETFPMPRLSLESCKKDKWDTASAEDKNLNLVPIGTIPVPQSKDKRSPAARHEKRYLVRQGATIFKKEIIR